MIARSLLLSLFQRIYSWTRFCAAAAAAVVVVVIRYSLLTVFVCLSVHSERVRARDKTYFCFSENTPTCERHGENIHVLFLCARACVCISIVRMSVNTSMKERERGEHCLYCRLKTRCRGSESEHFSISMTSIVFINKITDCTPLAKTRLMPRTCFPRRETRSIGLSSSAISLTCPLAAMIATGCQRDEQVDSLRPRRESPDAISCV